MKQIWYLCDPDKNTECRKSICKHNASAYTGCCIRTSHREYAKLDEEGKPIIQSVSYYPDNRDTEGNKIFEVSDY